MPTQSGGIPKSVTHANIGAHTTSAPRLTRQNTETTRPGIEELQKEANAIYQNPTKAKEHLARIGYLASNAPTTLGSISQTLLLLASSAHGKTLVEGIQAVAVILASESITSIGTDVAKVFADKITHTLQQLEKTADELQDNSDIIRKSTDRQYSTFEEMRDEIQTATENLKEVIQSNVNNTDAQIQQTTPTHTNVMPKNTYASTLKDGLPPSHNNTVARNRTKERQVLVDIAPDTQTNHLKNLTEKELVAKANEALRMMGMEWSEAKNAKVIGAKHLRNGGILYEFSTSASAKFIREEREEFTANFGEMVVVRDRAATVLVEYVPTSHQTDDDVELRRIEGETPGFGFGDVLQTRWVKPIERRNKGQRTAHLIVKLSNTQAANLAIRDGLIIAGKRVWARRLKKEPRRCLKCQKLNTRHLAAECKEKETCGTCGDEHRTATCTTTDPTKFKCQNCNEMGHASWDRQCPKFIHECKKLEQTDVENTYRYFPSDDPWTWEQNNGNNMGNTSTNSYHKNRQMDLQEEETNQNHEHEIEMELEPHANTGKNNNQTTNSEKDGWNYPAPLRQTTLTRPYRNNQQDSPNRAEGV